MAHDEEFRLGGDHPDPHIFMQIKGTDICMDFHCECGAFCHFDGFFAYRVRCPHCKQEWVLPMILFPRKPTSEDYPHDAKGLDPDEEHIDADGNAVPVAQDKEYPNA